MVLHLGDLVVKLLTGSHVYDRNYHKFISHAYGRHVHGNTTITLNIDKAVTSISNHSFLTNFLLTVTLM